MKYSFDLNYCNTPFDIKFQTLPQDWFILLFGIWIRFYALIRITQNQKYKNNIINNQKYNKNTINNNIFQPNPST